MQLGDQGFKIMTVCSETVHKDDGAVGFLLRLDANGFKGYTPRVTLQIFGTRKSSDTRKAWPYPTCSQPPDFSERNSASSTFKLSMASCGGVGTGPPSRTALENGSNISTYWSAAGER